MLHLKDISLAYGQKILFDQVNIQLYPGQKIGLVGKNGTGKSSLFKLILNQAHPEKGEINMASNMLIAHIEQEIINPQQELLDYVLNSHPLIYNQQVDLPEYYQLPAKAQKLLINLGFAETELQSPLAQFSGGWQMRANIAKALFSPSDLLLLDEPTNHLDVETVMWLEGWLKNYRGLTLIISHDREFLDNITTHTMAIESRKLTLYSGNYSTYERTKTEQLILGQKTAQKTKDKIAHLQNFVNRFKAKASKARQAQSRMKMIEKLRTAEIFHADRDYDIEFFSPEYSTNKILMLEHATIGYPGSELIKNVNLQIFAHDRIGLLGKNGIGKTSLIKAITEGTTLLQGNIELNPKIKVAYFAQHSIDQLTNNDNAFNYTLRTHPEISTQQCYNYLGRFGFNRDKAGQNLALYSGGEKSRLILANIILDKPNILFLDEPTNHLDMAMREELAIALQDYLGAVILVSHDKFLLQSVTDDFYLIKEHKLTKFSGDLIDYQNYLLGADSNAIPSTTKKTNKKK